MPEPTPAANAAQIDAALRLIDREVWIITAADGTRRGGLLATWVSAASIDRERPVLLAGMAPNHFTTELVQTSRVFAAHLLREDQVPCAWNFARDSGRSRDKLNGLTTTTASSGAPVLTDCLAWFDCRVFARYDAGDRLLFWADVLAAKQISLARQPLREQAFINALATDQKQELVASREADALALRPDHDRWRSTSRW